MNAPAGWVESGGAAGAGRRWLPAMVLAVACAISCVFPAATVAAGLPPEVAAALQRAQLPQDALSAVVLPVQPGTGGERLGHRAQQAMNPASLMKLVTTYAALDLLGPAFVWRTPVYLDGVVRDGVFRGNLYLRGQGDPKLVAERLWLLLRRVQALGVRRIEGDVVLDGSAFDVGPADPAAFDGEPLRPYNAAPEALLLNFKSVLLTFLPDAASGHAQVLAEPPLAGLAVPPRVPLSAGECGDFRASLRADFSDPARLRFLGAFPAACGERTWPVAYADPASYAARLVEGLWREMGGQIDGRVRQGTVPAGLRPVAESVSPPLAEVVRDINKFSNNVMAQQLFLTLAAQQGGRASRAAARETVLQWWRQRLGAADALVLDNGSGLSRDERISAQALAQLLQHAWASPLMPELLASLPVAGVDGTLRRSVVKGGAHLKTGSLRDVLGVAGYVHGARGQRWVLVAIVNHPNAAAARPALDALVEWTRQDR